MLYRAALAVICAAVIGTAAFAWGQEDQPQFIPIEKNIPHPKKDKGPRALGLLRMTTNGHATLVPIAIMIDGQFQDASAYKASPVPMALDSGTVYEAERTGKSLGLFTVNGALHSDAENAAVPWLGTGSWLAAGSEPEKKELKAESTPRGLDNDDAPPRLTRDKDENPSASKPASPPASTSSSGSSASSPSSQPGTNTNSKPDSSKPDAPTAGPQNGTKPVVSAPSSSDASSSSDEFYRPRLRRGKPTQPLPDDDDVPGYSRTDANGASVVKTSANAKKTEKALQPVELIPAISDAGGPEPHSYVFQFDTDEAQQREKEMTDLAKQQLQAFMQSEAKSLTQPSAKPTRPARRRKTAPRTPDLQLQNVQFRAFDLWSNNQPVMVLSAEADAPAESNAAMPQHYYITLVARTDIYSNLHKLYVGITDKYHLDVTPQLELIDAVDADGDGYGELLFRETSDIGSGYVIYRAAADSLWKMYDSLHPSA